MQSSSTEIFKPAIFSGPMVKALLENRKTMTRRLFSKRITPSKHFLGLKNGLGFPASDGHTWAGFKVDGATWPPFYEKVGYNVGNTIYVREKATFWEDPDDTYAPQWWYAADNEDGGPIGLPRWKPSIHMPKEAARIFLRVVEIRVERLMAITESDAISEGIKAVSDLDYFENPVTMYENYMPVGYRTLKPIESFLSLWQSIHGADSLKSDPWVKVIRFERVGMQNPWRK